MISKFIIFSLLNMFNIVAGSYTATDTNWGNCGDAGWTDNIVGGWQNDDFWENILPGDTSSAEIAGSAVHMFRVMTDIDDNGSIDNDDVFALCDKINDETDEECKAVSIINPAVEDTDIIAIFYSEKNCASSANEGTWNWYVAQSDLECDIIAYQNAGCCTGGTGDACDACSC